MNRKITLLFFMLTMLAGCGNDDSQTQLEREKIITHRVGQPLLLRDECPQAAGALDYAREQMKDDYAAVSCSRAKSATDKVDLVLAPFSKWMNIRTTAEYANYSIIMLAGYQQRSALVLQNDREILSAALASKGGVYADGQQVLSEIISDFAGKENLFEPATEGATAEQSLADGKGDKAAVLVDNFQGNSSRPVIQLSEPVVLAVSRPVLLLEKERLGALVELWLVANYRMPATGQADSVRFRPAMHYDNYQFFGMGEETVRDILPWLGYALNPSMHSNGELLLTCYNTGPLSVKRPWHVNDRLVSSSRIAAFDAQSPGTVLFRKELPLRAGSKELSPAAESRLREMLWVARVFPQSALVIANSENSPQYVDEAAGNLAWKLPQFYGIQAAQVLQARYLTDLYKKRTVPVNGAVLTMYLLVNSR